MEYERPHNYPEDYPHENGMYEHKCVQCNSFFNGHKRRTHCKVCYIKNLENQSYVFRQLLNANEEYGLGVSLTHPKLTKAIEKARKVLS